MNPSSLKKILLAVLGSGLVTVSAHAVQYDQNITPGVLFGDGVGNGSWTVDSQNGVELGLRGKLRFNGSGQPENTYNSNGDGTYSFAPGIAPTKADPVAVWSVEWSINSDITGLLGRSVNQLTYQFSVDTDPSAGVSFINEDVINDAKYALADHALGTNSTAAGAGIEDPANYLSNITQYNVAQNSWQAHWLILPTFDPTVDGTYDFVLSAFDGANQLASTSIQIIVGNGGASVPDSGSVALLMLGGLGCLAFWRRR